MLDFNKMTLKAQEAVHAAVELAKKLSHQEIDVEHLILGMLSVEENIAAEILKWSNFTSLLLTRYFESPPGARRFL
ncbi:Clp protease N-terminal domain-containing protein [bacterium]|nr:Clp protease N-terminal domain-containing protein [bacterium]